MARPPQGLLGAGVASSQPGGRPSSGSAAQSTGHGAAGNAGRGAGEHATWLPEGGLGRAEAGARRGRSDRSRWQQTCEAPTERPRGGAGPKGAGRRRRDESTRLSLPHATTATATSPKMNPAVANMVLSLGAMQVRPHPCPPRTARDEGSGVRVLSGGSTSSCPVRGWDPSCCPAFLPKRVSRG